MKKPKYFKIIIIIALLTLPLFAQARGLVPCGGYNESPCNVYDVFYLIARVTNWLLMVAGIYAVYQIVNHAFWLALTAGNEEAITKRREGITEAIVGLVFAFLAYLMVNTAVNLILSSKCKIDLRNPLNYLTVCDPNPANKDLINAAKK
jgi:hypothetical protein